MRLSMSGARVQITGKRSDAPPRIVSIYYMLELFTDESQDKIARLHRYLKKYGTVYNTVSGGTILSGEITTRALGGASLGSD